jgi:hypothetical protein
MKSRAAGKAFAFFYPSASNICLLQNSLLSEKPLKRDEGLRKIENRFYGFW